MQRFIKVCQIVLAIAFSAVSLGTVHATFPGENGVILSFTVSGNPYVVRTAASGTGNPISLASGQYPSASPDGSKVAFVGPFEELQIMNIDGSNLTSTGVVHVRRPTWSPDGKKIALIKGFAFYIVDVATNASTYLTETPDGPIERLSWSPQGDTLLVGTLSGTYLVSVADGQTVLASSLDWGNWFPGGKAFVALTDYPAHCAYKAGVDGSSQSLSACGLNAPAISPDGLTLLANDSSLPNTPLTTRTLTGQSVKTIPGGGYADWSRVPKTAMRSTLSNNQWTPGTPLVAADTYIAQGDLAVMPDGGTVGNYLRQEVIVAVDGKVQHRAQTLSGNWTSFLVVPGVGLSAGGFFAKRVAIAGALDGSAQVIAVGADDLAYHTMRYANGTWSGFLPLSGWSGATHFAARDLDIAIVNSSPATPGQAHVVANGLLDGDVYHRVRLDNGGWTPWGPISSPTAQTNQVAIAFDASANAYVLTTSPTQGVMRRVRYPAGNWSGWVNMPANGSNPLKDVSVTLDSALAVAWVSYIGVDGGVWTQKIDNPLVDASWTQPLLAPTHVMDKGRTVSIGLGPNAGPELVVVQVQPQ
jgi:dipeptidyl aminopeptidase/acylaminoacyl peptidase